MDKTRNDSIVKNQLARILDSPSFKKSTILSAFLRFIIHETLKGKEESLKEYIIATNVLKKNADFDPQLNAIVRIHASRLRNHLDDYYDNLGKNDPLKISIPKGRYIPIFTENKETQVSAEKLVNEIEPIIKSRPIIAILPIDKVQNNERLEVISSVFCQDLSLEFSQFPEIGVISHYTIQEAAEKFDVVSEIANHLNVDFVLTGSCIMQGEGVTIHFALNAVKEKQIIWKEKFTIDNFNDHIDYRPIIRKVIASTCGFFGFIYRSTLNAHIPNDYNHLYAIYWHNRYHKLFSEEAYHEAMKAAETGLAHNPDNSLLLAFKAELYLNLLVLDVQSENDFLQLGIQLLKKAIAIDPLNQHAYQVMAWANMLSHDKNALFQSIEKCLSINPYNAMYSGSVGFGYVCYGEYQKGLNLMAESIQLNPYYHWIVNVGFCFYYIHTEEFEEALIWADKINREKLLWDPLLRASLLGLLGRIEEAHLAAKELLQLSPNLTQRVDSVVNTFLGEKELKDKLIKGLRLSGIKSST